MKHRVADRPQPVPQRGQRTAQRGQPAQVVDRRQANLRRLAHNERVLTKYLQQYPAFLLLAERRQLRRT